MGQSWCKINHWWYEKVKFGSKWNIITDGHGDHYGGAQFIKDNFKTKIIMNETEL